MISVSDIPKSNFSFFIFSNKVLADTDVAFIMNLEAVQRWEVRGYIYKYIYIYTFYTYNIFPFQYDDTVSIADCDKGDIPVFPFLVIYSVFLPNLFHFIPFPSLDC